MARLTQHGLKRVLGTSALFSTAYGNVGSSIYYALGLVASYALGLTPIVFLITGVIFYLTAATYAEATAMYPEAGGSSSFARHAFNELWSFFAAWAQMLNYTITIAISAFFVPHYLGGLFWPALEHGPGDIIFGIAVVAVLSLVNVVGVKEAAGLNIVLAITDLATQLLLVIVGIVLVLSPHVLIHNVHLGVAPSWKDFLIAIPIGMIAYTGIETISNMAEEARDETKTVPRAIKFVVLAVFAIYAALPMVALSALPVHKGADGKYTTLLGTAEDKGGFAGDPVLGIVKHLHLGGLQSAGEIYVGLLAATILFIAANAGHHRRLAAGLLDGPAPPGPRSPQPPASALLHAVDRHPAVRRHRLPDDHPRPGRIPRQHVRVRRDAVVHDRAPVGDPPAHQGARPAASVSRAGDADDRRPPAAACSRCSASSAPASRSSS